MKWFNRKRPPSEQRSPEKIHILFQGGLTLAQWQATPTLVAQWRELLGTAFGKTAMSVLLTQRPGRGGIQSGQLNSEQALIQFGRQCGYDELLAVMERMALPKVESDHLEADYQMEQHLDPVYREKDNAQTD